MQSSTQTALPVSLTERSDILDILRGFALLGILLANSAVFSLYIFNSPETRKEYFTAEADSVLSFLAHAFIEGKFYSIFSLLFGIGFSIILLKNKSKGKNGMMIFYRRLFILLVFGLCHSFLLWDGDILFFYAIAGLFLPLFRNVKDKTLLWLVLILLLSPILFDVLKIVSKGKWNIADPLLQKAMSIDKKYGIEGLYPGNWLIVHDTYTDLRNWCHSGFWWGWFLRVDSNRIVKVFAMFLLGLYVGRNYMYANLQKYRPLLVKVQRFGLGLGIPAGLAYAWFEADKRSLPKADGILDTIGYALNVAPLALGYVATIALLYLNGKKSKASLQLLQPLGQMGLTNYIMQSLVSVSIYYGIGFGIGGKFGPALYMPIAITIFIVQVIYSNVWFKYFNYGPLEWIWRMLTYGKRLKIMKDK